METNNDRRKRSLLTLSIVLIAVAISIILASLFNVSYWIIVPSIVLLLLGIWNIFLGISIPKEKTREFSFGPNESTYLKGWGSIISITGILLLFYWFFPETDLVIFFALFILSLGIVSLFANVFRWK